MTWTVMPKAKEAFGNGDLSWRDDTFKIVLVDTALYTYSSAHEFLSSVASGARIATTAALTGKTATNGAFSASTPVVATSVPSAVTGESFYIFQDTGSDATSRLVAYNDEASGLTITTNGEDVWFNLPSPIFQWNG